MPKPNLCPQPTARECGQPLKPDPAEPSKLRAGRGSFAYDRLVSRRKMFSSGSVLTINEKIFAMFVKGKFVAKLRGQPVDELVRHGSGECFDPAMEG